MTAFTPQFVLLTTGVGALMTLLGLGRGLLQARSGSRRCPSCGRLIGGRVCRSCTKRAR
jgi:recombinational DNA repair protein RecR